MLTENTHCIYILTDPRDNTVRYVGRTQRPLRVRLVQHLNPTYSGDGRMCHWIEELKQAEIQPKIEVVESGLTLEEADSRETYWIRYYLKRDAPLNNISKVWVYNEGASTRQPFNEETGTFNPPVYRKRVVYLDQ